MRERFIFEKQYYEAVRELPKNQQQQALTALLNYIFYDEEPNTKIGKFIVSALKDVLDKNLSSYECYDERRSSKYRAWKSSVLERDGYQCQRCGSKRDLCVHHIKPFADYPEMRYSLKNGITLCKECHRMEHRNER